MSPETFYREQLLFHTGQLNRMKQKRNLITIGKLLTFCGIVICLYLFATESPFPAIPVGGGALFLFILFSVADSRIVSQIGLTKEIIRCHHTELEYLQYNYTSLDQGVDYLNAMHPYACDLDVFGEDSVFQHINRTVTANGKDMLAHWLLTPLKDPETIRQRQAACTELAEQMNECINFRALGQFHSTGQVDPKSIVNWQQEPFFFTDHKKAKVMLMAMNTVALASWIIAAAGLAPWSFALLLSGIQLLIVALFLKKTNDYHQRLGKLIQSVSNYLPLIRWYSGNRYVSTYLRRLYQNLFEKEHPSLKAISVLDRIQNGLDQRGNVLLAFVLNGLYMKDLHLLVRLDRWKEKYVAFLSEWLKAVSELDALVSMATYRYNHPSFHTPIISEETLLEAEAMSHPILKQETAVNNDFRICRLHKIIIVTGANMAGKSTFLRTVGVNLLLAQSGNVVCAGKFTFCPMTLFTSMRTTDNLSKGTSYFHAELLRLQQLVRLANTEERLFIILDEMLKGTNSVDKLNGSRAFLKKLLTLPISGLVATHDLALGELAIEYPEHFQNACFEITHTDTDISYDYKLHPGVSTTMNASILLQQMGLI